MSEAAPSRIVAAIVGETGTGKTEVAGHFPVSNPRTAIKWVCGDALASDFAGFPEDMRPDPKNIVIPPGVTYGAGGRASSTIGKDMIAFTETPWHEQGIEAIVIDNMSDLANTLLDVAAATGLQGPTKITHYDGLLKQPSLPDYKAAQDFVQRLTANLFKLQRCHLIVLCHPKLGRSEGVNDAGQTVSRIEGGVELAGNALTTQYLTPFPAILRTYSRMDKGEWKYYASFNPSPDGIYKGKIRVPVGASASSVREVDVTGNPGAIWPVIFNLMRGKKS